MPQIKVNLYDSMGSDALVTKVAKRCYGKDAKEADPRIINHLAESDHWNPFGHPHVTLECMAPIFTWIQLTRSRRGFRETPDDLFPLDVTNITQLSRRYSKSGFRYYMPDEWRLKGGGVQKKGSPEWDQTKTEWDLVQNSLSLWLDHCNRVGITAEMARMRLPADLMTHWWWTGSLAAFVRVCGLRLDPHAQLESQIVAKKINKIMSGLYPLSWEALTRDRT